MSGIKNELVALLNRALEMEHASCIQYLAHAEMIKGPNAEPIIERLKEIAADEQKHQDMLRNLIGGYLGGEPSMSLDKTYGGKDTVEILEVNLKGEKEAIDYYKPIYQKLVENKKDLPYEFETLEHEIRHIIIDEQEHVVELSTLLGK